MEPYRVGLSDLHDSHQFNIIADEEGRAIFQSKRWAESPKWLEGGEDHDEPIYLLKDLPTDYPELEAPNYYEVLNFVHVNFTLSISNFNLIGVKLSRKGREGGGGVKRKIFQFADLVHISIIYVSECRLVLQNLVR